MKQKTMNMDAEYGLSASTSWCDGEFKLKFENERHVLNVKLSNSQMCDLLAGLRKIIEKRKAEILDYEKAFQP